MGKVLFPTMVKYPWGTICESAFQQYAVLFSSTNSWFTIIKIVFESDQEFLVNRFFLRKASLDIGQKRAAHR